MHPTNRAARRTLAGLLLCGLACGSAARGQELQFQPPKRNAATVAPMTEERPSRKEMVRIGGSRELMHSSKKALKLAKSEKDMIATVQARSDDKAVIITGIQAGTSLVSLTDIDGKLEVIEVIVQLDVEYLKSLLDQAVPTANVKLIPGAGNTVIISGNVARSEEVETIQKIAGSVLGDFNRVINAMTVGGVMQVQLDVTIAQVDRSLARSRGFNFLFRNGSVSGGSILGSLTGTVGGAGSSTQPVGLGAVGVIPSAATAVPSSTTNAILGITSNTSQFQSLLQALKTENVAKILAEPKLVTLSGRPAHFLAGGRQAVLSQSSGISGPGVTFEEVGTELDFLPIVMGNGKIYLEVLPRIRSVNPALGLTVGNSNVPGFNEQEVRTSVLMEADQTFAIGGLIQNESQGSTTKVPILGEIPFLGALFSVATHVERELEIVVLVTPHLVDPQDCGQLANRLPGRETRSASDFELYLECLLEAPRGSRQVFVNKRYVPAYMNDPNGVYPCGDGSCTTGCAPSGAPGCSTCAPGLTPGGPIVPASYATPADPAGRSLPRLSGGLLNPRP